MIVAAGGPIVGTFTTSNSDGETVEADALPTAVMLLDGEDDAGVVTITDMDAGRYKFSSTCPAATPGQVVEVLVTAVIDAVTQTLPVRSYVVQPAVAVAAISEDAISSAAVSAAAVTKIQDGLATPTNITAGTITTVTNLTNAPANGDLTEAMKASVNAQVLDVLNVDTFAEPGQGAPAATTTLQQKIAYIYKWAKNKVTQTETTQSLHAADGTTVDHKRTVSDDGTTTTLGEIVSGP